MLHCRSKPGWKKKSASASSVLSTYDVTGQGNVLALAIQNKLTLEELAEADFFFQPGFDRQWSMLNLVVTYLHNKTLVHLLLLLLQ